MCIVFFNLSRLSTSVNLNVFISCCVTILTEMASLKERLNDNEYKLWIKAGLCLNHTKEGIENFTDDRSKRTHACVKTSVERHAIVKTPDADIKAMSEICNNAKVVKRGSRWSLGCCNDCEIYVKEIARLSQPPFRIELSNWCNSEVQLWPSEPWEIAKVYMNKGQRLFAFQKNSQETDLSGLLNFIDHCRIPWVDIQNKDNITKVIQMFLVLFIKLVFRHLHFPSDYKSKKKAKIRN